MTYLVFKNVQFLPVWCVWRHFPLLFSHVFIWSFTDLNICLYIVGLPGSSAVKNLPAMQEPQKMQVWSLGQEYPLEEGMATHFSVLAWRIPWTEEPGRLQSIGLQRVGHKWSNLAHMHLLYICKQFEFLFLYLPFYILVHFSICFLISR